MNNLKVIKEIIIGTGSILGMVSFVLLVLHKKNLW